MSSRAWGVAEYYYYIIAATFKIAYRNDQVVLKLQFRNVESSSAEKMDIEICCFATDYATLFKNNVIKRSTSLKKNYLSLNNTFLMKNAKFFNQLQPHEPPSWNSGLASDIEFCTKYLDTGKPTRDKNKHLKQISTVVIKFGITGRKIFVCLVTSVL